MTEINTMITTYEQRPLSIITDVVLSVYLGPTPGGQEPAQRWKARALWDTGAQMCAINTALAQDMGLEIAGYIAAGGFGGDMRDAPFFLVNLDFPDGIRFSKVPAVAYDKKTTHNFIIGMNVITAGDFSLIREHSGSRFSFTIDSPEDIDDTEFPHFARYREWKRKTQEAEQRIQEAERQTQAAEQEATELRRQIAALKAAH
jgi:hypothetical protein